MLPSGPIQTIGYLLTDAKRGEAVLVDAPGGILAKITPLLAKEGCTLTELWLTHGHWDHMQDGALVKQATGALVRAHRADQGLIVLTPGNVVDYSFVRSEINLMSRNRDLRKIMADPYNATKLGIELKEQDGLPIEFLRQGFLSLSAPTKELLRLILGGLIRHGAHPILRWHASNAIAEQDSAGNIKLSKRKSKRKIDGMAALVNAVAGASIDQESGPSVYESRGLLYV